MKKVFSVLFIMGAFMMLFGCSRKMSDIPKYKEKECHFSEGVQDHTDYCKYFYDENDVKKFKNHDKYKQVNSQDIENIKSYFKNFEIWVKEQNYYEKYDFDYQKQIKEGDYFYIVTKEDMKIGDDMYGKFDYYDVYYFDTSKFILYFIHSNN